MITSTILANYYTIPTATERRPETPGWAPEAVAIHGLDIVQLAREGLSRRDGFWRSKNKFDRDMGRPA